MATLFGEFIIERTYGNIRYKTPTGIKKEFFNSMKEAGVAFEKLINQKKKKGYL
jgi:predicted DNA-binding WGR domain protein